MSYSYKPVFMLASINNMDETGSARLEEVAREFAQFYETRRANGLQVEKKACIFTRGGYTQREVERLILSMPFKRFEDMHVMHHARQLGTLQFYKQLFRQLTSEDIEQVKSYCNRGIDKYFK